MKTYIVKEDTNLKDFTDATYPQGSFCLAALLRARDVKINGVRTGKNVPLKCGDTVVYYTTPKQEGMPSHKIIYEDENILIADKPSGVSSEGLTSELKGKGEYYAVHRLDRNTQGLIVFAKNRAAEEQLLQGFKDRKVHKTYIALCKNAFKADAATLEAYLKKDEKCGLVKIFSRPTEGAASIVTEYCVKERYGDTALVQIILHTGKTHQIRAHLASIGCPVLGDEKYGDGALNAKYGVKRQRLIAKCLSFELDGALSYLNGQSFESEYAFSDDL